MIREIAVLFGLTLAQGVLANERVTEMDEDISMLVYRAGGVELASSQIGLALAEMIFKRIYGESDFQTQTPLHLEDGGDRWIIEGRRRAEDYPMPPGQASSGKVQIVILKANCQILKLTQKTQLPTK
jgi:NTF2 fold immunity protein